MKSKQMFILPMIIVAFLFLLTLAANSLHPTRYIKCDTNKLTVEKAHLEDGEAVIEKIKIPKGTKVKVHQKQEHSSIIIYITHTPMRTITGAVKEFFICDNLTF